MLHTLYQRYGAGGGGGVSGMAVGMNLGNLTNYSNAKPFANLLFSAEEYTQTVGSGSFTQSQGTISATVSTDIFRSVIHDPNAGATIPAGSYTLVNPTGTALMALQNGFSDGSGQTFSAAASFPFTYDGTSILCVYVKGSLAAGATMPYLVKDTNRTAYEAGNPWTPEFLAWMNFLNPKVLRTMDWTAPMYSCEEDWADRVVPNRPTLHKPEVSYFGNVVPYEFIVDLANRLNKDVWVCCPPRSTAAYRTSLAALMNNGTGAVATPGCGNIGMTGLAAGLKWYVELGNELWNGGNPFAMGGNWIGAVGATRYTATHNTGTNNFTWTGHGLTTGAIVRGWASKATRAGGADESGNYKFLFSLGGRLYVNVVDANTISIADVNDGTHTPITIEADVVSVIFSKEADMASAATFFDAIRANTGSQSLDLWTKAAAAMGTSRIVRVAPSQSGGGTAMSAAILNPTGVAEACDALAIAPYNRAELMGGAVDISTGQLLPKFWCNQSGTVHVGVYANGSTPTKADILAGAGTGFINHQSTAYSAGSSSYTNLTAVTGLTNTTTYSVFFAFVSGLTGRSSYTWVFSNTATVSATPSTKVFDDTFANLNSRLKLFTDIDSLSEVQSHLAAIAASRNTAIKLVCYEANSDWSASNPANVGAWLKTYLESSSSADGLNHYLRSLASQGMVTTCIYTDILGGSVFDMADSYTDTVDVRATQVHSYGGTVPFNVRVSVADVTASDITAAPSLPYTVATFANAALTYSLIGGDDVGNYSIVGNALKMNSTTGINFSSSMLVGLKVRATDGATDCVFNVGFFTGAGWYASDAAFVWDTTVDTDTAAVDPTVGPKPMPLSSGVAATASAGLWTNTTGGYSTFAVFAAPLDMTKGFLWAFVCNKGAIPGNGFYGMSQLAGFPRLTAGPAGNSTFDWYVQSGSIDQVFAGSAFDSTTAVRWFFVDPVNSKVRWGKNQAEEGTPGGIAIPAAFPASFSTDLGIGEGVPAVLGSMQFVNRAGLTYAQALAMVQKMQTLHSIP